MVLNLVTWVTKSDDNQILQSTRFQGNAILAVGSIASRQLALRSPSLDIQLVIAVWLET